MNALPSLSIIVPVYNEEKTVENVMKRIVSALPDAEVIYIDDGSCDRSLDILKKYARKKDMVLTKTNGGKGSAVRMGLEYAHGEFTIIQDADMEYDPREILELLREAVKNHHDVVFGSRFLRKNPNVYRRYLIGNKVLSAIISMLFLYRITDSYTCYKLIKTNLFRSLNIVSKGFEIEAEICGKCLKKDIKIKEVPISYRPRKIEEGKKIKFIDALKGVWTMVQTRFTRVYIVHPPV